MRSLFRRWPSEYHGSEVAAAEAAAPASREEGRADGEGRAGARAPNSAFTEPLRRGATCVRRFAVGRPRRVQRRAVAVAAAVGRGFGIAQHLDDALQQLARPRPPPREVVLHLRFGERAVGVGADVGEDGRAVVGEVIEHALRDAEKRAHQAVGARDEDELGARRHAVRVTVGKSEHAGDELRALLLRRERREARRERRRRERLTELQRAGDELELEGREGVELGRANVGHRGVHSAARRKKSAARWRAVNGISLAAARARGGAAAMLAAIVRAGVQFMCVSGGVLVASQHADTTGLPKAVKWTAVVCAIFCLAEHLAQFFGETRWNLLWAPIAAVIALLSTTISCSTLAEFSSVHKPRQSGWRSWRDASTLAILREAFRATRSMFVVLDRTHGQPVSAADSAVQLAIGAVCQCGAYVYLQYYLPSPSAQLLRAWLFGVPAISLVEMYYQHGFCPSRLGTCKFVMASALYPAAFLVLIFAVTSFALCMYALPAALYLVAGLLFLPALPLLALFNRRFRRWRAATLVKPAFLNSIRKSVLRRTPPSLIETATITSFALCGDGKASTTDRIYIKLTWSGRNADKLPEHAILKISLLHPWLRIGGETALRGAAVAARLLRPLKLDWVVYRAANTYNFVLAHAPDAMYDNEVTAPPPLHHPLHRLTILSATSTRRASTAARSRRS